MEVATVRRPNHAVVFHRPREAPGMSVATPNQAGAFVFHPPSRRRHRHHRSRYYHNYPPDSDTDSTTLSTQSSWSSSSTDSDSDDDAPYYHHHRVSFRPRHRARRRRDWWGGWPRTRGPVLAYPDACYASSPWTTTTPGLGVIGTAAPAGLITTAAGTVVPQIQFQQQTQAQQQQQQQPRRYGYRRLHYQGGERVRSTTGCGHGHGHGHGNHHHHRHHHNGTSLRSPPRRCILPRFGRWLVGDPPDRVRRSRRCEDGCGGGDCCDHGCGVGGTTTSTTPTVHHEDEYWGPGHHSNIPNWATGSQTSPWRYGGPNGNSNIGPGGTVGPGGTIEEVEEGGTAPVQQPSPATTIQPTAVLPVPVATPTDPYDDHQQQPRHTHHYHLNDDDGRRSRHKHRRHRLNDENGILGLVERERRRDSERQMADADASHRREAMMMELMERARRGERDRDRDRGRGGGDSGFDARDILGVLLDGVVAERRRGRRGDGDVVVGEGGGRKDGSHNDDGLRGALDALSRRVDEMVLSEREKGRAAERVAAPAERNVKQDVAPRVKFNKVDSSPAASGKSNRNVVDRPSGGKKGGTVGGKISFGHRGKDGDQSDTDTDETSRLSLVGGRRGVRRGRTLKRAGSTSTSAD